MPYEKGVRLMPHIRLSEATLRVNRRWREANAAIMLLGNGESKRFGRRFFPIVLLVRPRWYVWYGLGGAGLALLGLGGARGSGSPGLGSVAGVGARRGWIPSGLSPA